MTNPAVAQNSDVFAQLQALLRQQQVLHQIVLQLAQAFQTLIPIQNQPQSSTLTTSDTERGTVVNWLPPERQAELEQLAFAAFDIRIGGIQNFEAFVQLLETTQQALTDHWSSVPPEAQQQLTALAQSILNLFEATATGCLPVPVETTHDGTRSLLSFRPLLRYLRTTWTLIQNPSQTLNRLKQLLVVLAKFARTVQRLNDRDRKVAEFQRKLAQSDWNESLQIERNQGAIAWIRARIEKDEQMTEEEQDRAEVEFDLFKEIIDAHRSPGNKLYANE